MLMWMIEYAVCGSLLLHIGLGVVADFMSSLILAGDWCRYRKACANCRICTFPHSN